MKHFITLFIIMLAFGLSAQSKTKPNATRDSNGNYTALASTRDTSQVTETEYIYTDSKGVMFKVYVSARGKHFIYKRSKTTNQLYKYYLHLPSESKQ